MSENGQPIADGEVVLFGPQGIDGHLVGGVGGTPVMAPPTGQAAWRRGPYDLRLVSGDPSIGDAVVTATRYDGLEAVSYGYSTACGVTWINFSNGDEVFYPEGRSLFWTQACTDGAAMMPTK